MAYDNVFPVQQKPFFIKSSQQNQLDFYFVNKTRISAVAETAQRFVSLNILLSHSRSLKIILNDTA